jgi:hypothetical protein
MSTSDPHSSTCDPLITTWHPLFSTCPPRVGIGVARRTPTMARPSTSPLGPWTTNEKASLSDREDMPRPCQDTRTPRDPSACARGMTTCTDRLSTWALEHTCKDGSPTRHVLPRTTPGREGSSTLARRRARGVPGTCSHRGRWRTLALPTSTSLPPTCQLGSGTSTCFERTCQRGPVT